MTAFTPGAGNLIAEIKSSKRYVGTVGTYCNNSNAVYNLFSQFFQYKKPP